MSDSRLNTSPTLSYRLIGGRYAFSWISLVGSFPFIAIGFIATEVSAETTQQWWAYGLIAVFSHLAIGSVFLVARTVQRVHRSETLAPLWIVLGVYLVASQVRLVTVLFGFDIFGLPNEVPIWARVMTSGLLFTLVFGLSSYGLEALRRYREKRAELISDIVGATTELDERQRAVSALRAEVFADVDREIEEVNRDASRALGELAEDIRSGLDVRPELKELLESSDSRWRGISHDTWRRAEIDVPKPRLVEVFDVIARSKPVSLGVMAVSGVSLFSLILGRTLPLPEALAVTGAWVVIAVFLGWGVNELGARVSRGEKAFGVVGLVVLIGAGAGFFLVPGLPDPQVFGAWTIHITNVFAALLWGFAPSLAGQSQLVIDALQRRLDQSTLERLRVESELVVIAQQIASRLHGSTRGEFLARVLEMQKALDRQDREAAVFALESLQRSLETGESGKQDPSDGELEQFLSAWSGFAEITSNLGEVVIPAAVQPAVTTLVMEAVNNAVRHGDADSIAITVNASSDRVDLHIVNRGKPLEAGFGPGMGAAIFDRLATGGWDIRSEPEGLTTLVARIAVNSQAAVRDATRAEVSHQPQANTAVPAAEDTS
jgi:signal transduction histidine kinase